MKKSTIVFDAECNLCNGVMGWLLRLSPKDQFQLVPFQSPEGQQLLLQRNMVTDRLDTVILFDENGEYTHSDGFLRILSKIPKWRWVSTSLALIPRNLRDFIYKTAARNRVRWFGKSQTCAVSLG